ncbi:BON domain-containing protein [Paraglaciecola aquimarina]|uniref:BON domain-containing protein n=1 Tax=Paraglaciecola algarum TaxID=3050085 RepID=A0ABS9DBH7_9ALTE|nr:division/outer membrane stress-associated lipid-binding lipoprotein [Paraglaciecola sp. G1-23]MCF2949358.1 BON domain-containing protein [Paraglaciecola sp. G1-23]
MKIKNTTLALTISSALLLQGCAGLIVGAGMGAVAVAHDNRTIGTQLDDKTTGSKIATVLGTDEAIKNQTNITVQVFNGTVLLVGQAPTQNLIQHAGKLAASVKNIKKIHNQIRLGAPIPPSVVAHDLWLSSKIKTKLIADKRIDGLNIEIEIENGEVFLMGLITAHEAAIAVEVTRHIEGVKQVIKAFEYLD